MRSKFCNKRLPRWRRRSSLSQQVSTHCVLPPLAPCVLTHADGLPEEAATHKARVAFVRGKALDASEKYSKEAEEQLAKAVRGLWALRPAALWLMAVLQVKLEPSNYEAWNALGNCFWKKGAVRDAYLCFKHALEQVRL